MRISSSYLLVIVMCGVITASSAAASAQGRKTRPNKPVTTRTVNYPKIRAAIASLEAAKAELQNSDKDFGGHKQEALDAINDAVKRLRLALQFEKY
jgi:hypothetical protein